MWKLYDPRKSHPSCFKPLEPHYVYPTIHDFSSIRCIKIATSTIEHAYRIGHSGVDFIPERVAADVFLLNSKLVVEVVPSRRVVVIGINVNSILASLNISLPVFLATDVECDVVSFNSIR